MPINEVKTGDLLTSSAWNHLVKEINLKANRTGDIFSGELTIQESLTGKNATFSGNLNVNTAAIQESLTGKNATFSGELKANKLEINEDLSVRKLVYGKFHGEKINFWGGEAHMPAIGTQDNVLYFRSYGSFNWYKKGVHSDTSGDAGADGMPLMSLDDEGNLRVAKYITSNNFSDARLKKNVQNLENALDQLSKLRGVTFEWKNPENHRNDARVQTGMIAQEVERIFPTWVSEHEGKKHLIPVGFEGLVVEALKELKQRIVNLEQR